MDGARRCGERATPRDLARARGRAAGRAAAPPPDAPAAPPPLPTIAPIASAPIAPVFSHALDLDQHRAAPAAARSPDPTAHPWAPPSSTPPRLRPAAAAAPSAPDAAAAVEEPAELGIEAWAASVSRKSRQCVQNRHGALYLYHARKAAGTSLRERLQASARAHRVELLETEGVTLDERFLALDGVVSATTLRDPIERAVSMYWYEHVGWWDGIQHDPSKLKTLHDWVETWRDGSEWKRSFVAKRENRRSVYVEVENYFVKALSGFEHRPDGSGRVGARELAMAKAALARFDVVLRVEDLLAGRAERRQRGGALARRRASAAGPRAGGADGQGEPRAQGRCRAESDGSDRSSRRMRPPCARRSAKSIDGTSSSCDSQTASSRRASARAKRGRRGARRRHVREQAGGGCSRPAKDARPVGASDDPPLCARRLKRRVLRPLWQIGPALVRRPTEMLI